jgi:hypothetical protein
MMFYDRMVVTNPRGFRQCGRNGVSSGGIPAPHKPNSCWLEPTWINSHHSGCTTIVKLFLHDPLQPLIPGAGGLMRTFGRY